MTFLHADRLTDVRAEVNGDKAVGTVSFKAPDLYEGRVEYTATRADNKWKIIEWRMPGYKIHLVRDSSDRWVRK